MIGNKYNRLKGVYLIELTNRVNDGNPKYYIGQADDIFERLNTHFSVHNPTQNIDKAIKHLKPTSFKVSILEIVSSQENRNSSEQKYIGEFIKKYGEKALFNSQSGGKSGSVIINKDIREEKRQRNKIICEIFEKCIDFPVYLVAENCEVSWYDVCQQRKKLFPQNNLKYDSKAKKVVDSTTGKPWSVWNGGRLTKRQVSIYKKNYKKYADDLKSLADLMNISITDLKIFFIPEYDKGEYKSAEEVCDISLLKNTTTPSRN